MKKILKIIGVILLLAVLAFLGTCAYKVFTNQSYEGPKPPDITKAHYQVKIINTGVTIYTDLLVETKTDIAGKSVYSLPKGYWETNEKKFTFKNIPLTLDERIFGEIEVTKR